MKKIEKTETMAEFLARGGKVTLCDPYAYKKKRSYTKRDDEQSGDDTVDMNLIPEGLKITLGIR